MRRAMTTIGISVAAVLTTAGGVLAQTGETNQSDGLDVGGVGGVGGTATTGGDLTLALVAVGVLLAVGLVTLFLTRRWALRLDVDPDQAVAE